MPYYLAPLWDLHFAPAAAQAAAARHRRATAAGAGSGHATAVPKQLRQTLKRARGAKTLLQTLEEQIRAFIAGSGDHGPTAAQQQQQELSDGEYSVVGAEDLESDEEIVVLGRDGEEDEKARVLGRARRSARKRLICEGLVEDQHASFGSVSTSLRRLGWCLMALLGLITDDLTENRRWLVHSIADYYGLLTWSVTIGNPARREAYVGIRDGQNGQATSDPSMRALPRPLWVAL